MPNPNDPAEDGLPGTADLRPEAFTWDAPDRSLLSSDFGDAPRFPVDMLGPFWSQWVALSARAANAPIDYTAGTLLATVGAMLGNVRWPNVEGVWEHPCVLWIGLVGNPSTAKSPGMRPVRKLIHAIEQERARQISDAGPAHRLQALVAEYMDRSWKREVEETLATRPKPAKIEDLAKDEVPPNPLEWLPAWPSEAQVPAAPVVPVLHVVDATTEGLIATAAGSPRGLLQFSDELAGWFGGFDRYRAKGVSADRPFWLKAFDGDPYSVIRKGGDLKNGLRAPVEIPHLSIGVIGSVQPDPLRAFLTKTDDGLAHRFLWMWPRPAKTFTIPRRTDTNERADDAAALAALMRIECLQQDQRADPDRPEPERIELTDEAVDRLQDFGQQMMDAAEGCSAWYASTLNKAPGQVLRLSAVLSFLHWCAEPDGTPVPRRIGGAQMQEAIILMSAYFLQQARRVRQTAAVGDGEADARAVLAVIRERKWERFTGRQLQRVASGRLADTRNRKAACEILVEAGLLREDFHRAGETKGRAREEYVVNTGALWPQAPADTAEAA